MSIINSKYDNCRINEIIIVDNNSNDNSIKLIENIDGPKLKIIFNEKNLGFGKACNIGAKNSKNDFILFLNPDAMVYKNTFQDLFRFTNETDDGDVGVYGVQLIGDDGKVQKSCARIPNLWNMAVRTLGLNKLNNKIFQTYAMDDWKHDKTKNVEHIMGAFYLIKTNLFHKINGFDERYFVYIEDLDLSKRVLDSGYKLTYVTEAQAYHKGGGVSEQVKAMRLFYSTRSRIIYGLKYFGCTQGIFLLLFTFLLEPISRTIFLILKGKYSEIIESFKGFGMLYKDTFNIIKLGLKK